MQGLTTLVVPISPRIPNDSALSPNVEAIRVMRANHPGVVPVVPHPQCRHRHWTTARRRSSSRPGRANSTYLSSVRKYHLAHLYQRNSANSLELHMGTQSLEARSSYTFAMKSASHSTRLYKRRCTHRSTSCSRSSFVCLPQLVACGFWETGG